MLRFGAVFQVLAVQHLALLVRPGHAVGALVFLKDRLVGRVPGYLSQGRLPADERVVEFRRRFLHRRLRRRDALRLRAVGILRPGQLVAFLIREENRVLPRLLRINRAVNGVPGHRGNLRIPAGKAERVFRRAFLLRGFRFRHRAVGQVFQLDLRAVVVHEPHAVLPGDRVEGRGVFRVSRHRGQRGLPAGEFIQAGFVRGPDRRDAVVARGFPGLHALVRLQHHPVPVLPGHLVGRFPGLGHGGDVVQVVDPVVFRSVVHQVTVDIVRADERVFGSAGGKLPLHIGVQVVILSVPQGQHFGFPQRLVLRVAAFRSVRPDIALVIVQLHAQLHRAVIEGHAGFRDLRAALVAVVLALKLLRPFQGGAAGRAGAGLEHHVLTAVGELRGDHMAHDIAARRGGRPFSACLLRLRRHPGGAVRIAQGNILVFLGQGQGQLALVAVNEPVAGNLLRRFDGVPVISGKGGARAQHLPVNRQVFHLVMQRHPVVIEGDRVVVIAAFFRFVGGVLPLIALDLDRRFPDQHAAGKGLHLAAVELLVSVPFPEDVVHRIERLAFFHRNGHGKRVPAAR